MAHRTGAAITRVALVLPVAAAFVLGACGGGGGEAGDQLADAEGGNVEPVVASAGRVAPDGGLRAQGGAQLTKA